MEPNKFVVDYLSELQAGNLVDLAGGEGRNALWFANRGWQVENVEFSKVALDKFAKRAEHEKLDSRCIATLANALDARFTLKADLLLVAYLQIPNAELFSALSNAIGQLKPGAMVFGVWHAKRNLREGFGGPPDEKLLVDPSQLKLWADENLELAEVFELEREVDEEGVRHVAIDVILKGQLPKSE